jgi:hypothetical protein
MENNFSGRLDSQREVFMVVAHLVSARVSVGSLRRCENDMTVVGSELHGWGGLMIGRKIFAWLF